MKAIFQTKAENHSTLRQLLTSGTRARLLTILLTQPNQEFYLRELARLTGKSVRAVQHELPRLEGLGLLQSRRRGREKYYQANTSHPIYPELRRIVYKTAALGDILRAALGALQGVETAFIYGSVAKGQEQAGSDVDLLIIGSPPRERLEESLRQAEETIGREVSLTIINRKEWDRRLGAGDRFARQVERSQKIFLVGDEQDFR